MGTLNGDAEDFGIFVFLVYKIFIFDFISETDSRRLLGYKVK